MILIILAAVRIILLCFVVYFILRLFFLLRNLHNETRLFVPTVQRVLPSLWKEIRHNQTLRKQVLGKHDRFKHFIDLGAGDGSIVAAAYSLRLAHEVTGVEIQSGLYWWGKVRLFLAKVLNGWSSESRIHWTRGDATKVALQQYDCVYLFMVPENLELLSDNLRRHAQPGTVVLSWVFPLPHMHHKLVRVMPLKGLKASKDLHIYVL